MMKKWLWIGILFLASCSRQVYITEVDPEYLRIDEKRTETDNEIAAIIAPYKQDLNAKMQVVIGEVSHEMIKERPNSSLGNWIADLIYDMATLKSGKEIDFAVQNYGGIRVPSVSAGQLTVGKVYELMPFDNMITIITADGPTTRQLLDRIADYGGWPVSKQLNLTITDGQASNITIHGEPFDLNRSYTFALPDYIANGGDKCFFLENNEERIDLDLLIRDAIIQHVSALDKPIPYIDEKRIF